MERRFVLYSNIWVTALMFALFLFSGLTSSRGADYGSLGLVANNRYRSTSHYLQGKVIVIDPGHGGGDPGTLGVGSTTEAENVMAIAWELKALLEKAGAKVVMTRQGDRLLSQATNIAGQKNQQLASRVSTANRSSGEIFISLHNDWNDNKSVQGTSVYYYKVQDLALAEMLHDAVVGQLGSVDLGVKYGNFYVLRNTDIPAALVEVGFLSNPEEAAKLAKPTYRLEVARGLFRGINEYFKQQL